MNKLKGNFAEIACGFLWVSDSYVCGGTIMRPFRKYRQTLLEPRTEIQIQNVD